MNQLILKKSTHSRESILEAAANLVHEHGASSLTLDATCARAGMSKGGLLYHFRSKEDLLLALMEDRHAAMEAAIRKEFDQDTGLQSVGRNHRAFIRAVFQILLSEDPFQLSVLGGIAVQLLASGGDFCRKLQASFSCHRVGWDALMAEDGIPASGSLIILSSLDGLISRQIVHQDIPPREILVKMRDRLLDMASPKPSNSTNNEPPETA